MPACPRASVSVVPIADVSGVASPIGMYQTVFPFRALTPDTGLTASKVVAAALYFATSALIADVLALEALAVALEVEPMFEVAPVLDEFELDPLLEHAPTARTTAATPVIPMSFPSPLR
jgi:hypothetical protein